MRVPYTISPNVFQAYRCSVETAVHSCEADRTVHAEDQSWDDSLVPDLKVLAIYAIASAWKERPLLEELPTCMDRVLLLEILPADLPFELTITRISEEYYWKRASKHRWEYNNPGEHGNSWRRLYCERHLAEYLEKMPPSSYESAEEEREKLLELLRDYVHTLRIRSLEPTRKPEQPEISDDEDPCFVEEDVVNHIPIGKIFPQLPHLSEIYLNFGLIYLNDGFEWRDFEFSLDDAKTIGNGVKNCPSLRKFSLTRSNLDQPRAAAILQGLLSNTSVEEVDFSHCKLSDKGAFAVGEFLSMHEYLKVLEVANNNIGPDGLAGIVHGLLKAKSTSLKSLILRLNPLEEAGVAHICSLLLRNESLEFLDISACGFTAGSGIELAEVLASEYMKYPKLSIDLSNNDFGPIVGEAFEVAMKSCRCVIGLETRLCNFSKESEYSISESVLRNKEAMRRAEARLLAGKKSKDRVASRAINLECSRSFASEKTTIDEAMSVRSFDNKGGVQEETVFRNSQEKSSNRSFDIDEQQASESWKI